MKKKQLALDSKKQNYKFVKYISASGVALIVDSASYLIVAKNTSLSLPQAAVIGYSVGLIIAYYLMRQRIYVDGWLADKRIYEFILFLLSGLLGILLTYVSVWFVADLLNFGIFASKFFAICVSFFGVYFFRSFVVFKPCQIL